MMLIDFLLARLAEDEETARAASPGPWRVSPDDPECVVAADDIEVVDAFALTGPQIRATAAHIARHDPVRVLADCHARRTVIEACASSRRLGHEVLYLLVQPYWDHTEFDLAWLA